MSTVTKAPESGKHRAGKTPKAAVEQPQAPDAAPSQHEPKAPPALEAQRRPVLRLVALFTLVAVTVGAAVVAFLVHRSNSHTQSLQAVQSARQEAVTAAGQDVPKILGYDYRNLSADIKGAKALATGQFLSDYSATAQKVLASAPSVKAIVTATVSDQSVVQAQGDRVTLLLFVDQESVKQLSGQKTATTRIDPFRVQVTMSKVHGRWMVSDLEPI
jgi:Mce-associated membrane protein